MAAFRSKRLTRLLAGLLAGLLARATLCALVAIAALSAFSESNGPRVASAGSIASGEQWDLRSTPPQPPIYPDRASWSQHRLCELSNHAQVLVNRTSNRIGVAAIDLVDGQLWVGGDAGTFALHSVAKAPIAWLTLDAAERRGEALSATLEFKLQQMIAWSDNEPVPLMLEYIGGLPALDDFYRAHELDGMVEHFDEFSWARGRGRPADVAATFAVLATAADISPAVREDGFELLRNVIDAQRWGAADPPTALHGWSALVKTGQFVQRREGLRLNSAAIWLDAAGHPRYVVAIMAAEQTEWGISLQRQDLIGAAIGAAIAAREMGGEPPPAVCAPTLGPSVAAILPRR